MKTKSNTKATRETAAPERDAKRRPEVRVTAVRREDLARERFVAALVSMAIARVEAAKEERG